MKGKTILKNSDSISEATEKAVICLSEQMKKKRDDAILRNITAAGKNAEEKRKAWYKTQQDRIKRGKRVVVLRDEHGLNWAIIAQRFNAGIWSIQRDYRMVKGIEEKKRK